MRPGLRYVSKADVRADKAARLNLIRMETSMLARLFATISVAALLLAVTMISASDAGFRRLRSSYVPGRSHYRPQPPRQRHHLERRQARPVMVGKCSCLAAPGRIAGAVAKRRCVSRLSISSGDGGPHSLTGLRHAVARMRRLRLPPLGILVLSRSEFRQETDCSGARGRIAQARHDRR